MGDTGFSEYLLVDGVGRPHIVLVQDALVPATAIRWPHPVQVDAEPLLMVNFDRSNRDTLVDGRQVYRMRGSGLPEIRSEYLPLDVITALIGPA